MKIVLFGTGFVGSALAHEFAARRHQVTTVSRHSATVLPEGNFTVTGSVLNPEFVTEVTTGAEVIVSALPPIGDEFASGVAALVQAAGVTGARLGVVGGSAILPLVEGGPRQVETPGFPDWLVPRIAAHDQVLNTLTSAPEGIDWFYLVPAAEFGPHQPGVRTGRYRTSATAQVTDGQGRSVIGVQDYAIAFADEIDQPRTHRGWLAVGY